MGAWGTAAFDNDDASDWVYDLEKRGVDAIESALSDALAATELAMPTDVNAIAAGEVIAAALGHPAAGLREDVLELANAVAPDITADHAGRARAAAERALAASEVADLWREAPDDDVEWQRMVGDLIERLGR